MINNNYLRELSEYRVRWFIVAVFLAVAAVMGPLIAVGVLEPKSLIVVLAGVSVGLFIVRSSDRALQGAYFLAIVAFAVGHRSLYVGISTFFVPAELIAWALFFLLIARSAVERRWLGGKLPWSLVFLVAWCLLGLTWTPDLIPGWDTAFSMLKLWVFALPAFVLTGGLIREVDHLKRILKTLILVALYISAMAIVEFSLPGVTKNFPWFFNAKLALIQTEQGFARSGFSFWGNPIAVIIIGWGMVTAFDELITGRSRIWKIIALAALATGVVALYISGQRASWISVPLGLAVLAFLSPKRRLGIGVLVALIAPAIFLPASFWLRFTSILPSSSSYVVDSSLLGRLDRYRVAIDETLRYPLTGVGFDGSLVHNEFLAFAAHVGLPAMVAFIILLSTMGLRLVGLYRHPPSPEIRRFAALFLAMFVSWLVDLNFHPALGVAPITVPYWFMLSLGWYLPSLKSNDQILGTESSGTPMGAMQINGGQQT